MKTTKRHFKVFKAEVERWVNNFGLHDWEVSIHHGDVGNDEHAAECIADPDTRNATIQLSDEFTILLPFSEMDIRRAGCHEALELLLARLSYLAESRSATYEQIGEARHEVIARLLNYFYRRKP